MAKTLVQEQFGKTAASYLTSTPHAKGKSLERLVDLAQPKKDWRVLDVATGGGHVAYIFAPHVARVWATDITDEMLELVRGEAGKRELANVRTAYAKAEALPFDDASFELVTCRIAPHHFDSIPAFLREVHRVLTAGRRVRAGRQRRAARQRRRLRQCVRTLPRSEPSAGLDHAGMARCARGSRLLDRHEEEIYKTMDFSSWAERHDDTMRALLSSMLDQVTNDVAATLQPERKDGSWSFRLCEGLFVARKK